MSGQNRPSASGLALVALASLVIASHVEANLFGRDKSYERLANDLQKLITSGKGRDIVSATGDLNIKFASGKKNLGYRDLAIALGSLHVTNDNKVVCDVLRLKNLRFLAIAMAAHGNLELVTISEPIERLNEFIIKRIIEAQNVCFEFLAKKWPTGTESQLYEALSGFDSIPSLQLLKSKPPNLNKLGYQPLEHLRPACISLNGTRTVVTVLKPYMDLLMAAHIIDVESKKFVKFYQDDELKISSARVVHPNDNVLKGAYRMRACELLTARRKASKNSYSSIFPKLSASNKH